MNRNYIHPTYLLAILLLPAACSSHRETARSMQRNAISTIQSQHLADSSLQLTTTGSLLLHHEQQQLRAEIIPAGPFVYHTDSGYRGTASRVTVYRQRNDQTLRRDSSHIRQQTGSVAQQQTASSETHSQARYQLEKHTEPVRLPYWPVILVVAAGIVYRVLLRRIPAWLRKN